jgi:cell pole-organizing protein PopZ
MSQAAKAQEPSMEEILASIRRIIADDEPGKANASAAKAAPRPAPAPAPGPRAVVPPPAKPADTVQSSEPSAMLRASEPASMLPVEAENDDSVGDILDLTEQMAQPEPSPAPAVTPFRTIDAQPDVVFAEAREPDPIPEMPPVPELLRQVANTESSAPDRPLMSQTAMSAVDSAFNTLAHTVLVQNARTLEDIVREMLRPMLKAWLDDNLPGLVERLVRAEIERVSRGRSS